MRSAQQADRTVNLMDPETLAPGDRGEQSGGMTQDLLDHWSARETASAKVRVLNGFCTQMSSPAPPHLA
jgi:hypothetical protein